MANQGELLRAYLVIGEDEYKSAEVLKRMKAHVSPELEAFNLDELDYSSPNFDVDTLQSSINMLPFGMGPRIVIFKNADKLTKEVSDYLASYLAQPNEAATLLVQCTAMDKRSKLYKAFQKLDTKAIIALDPPKEYQVPDMVCSMAQKLGFSIDHAAAEELVKRVGTSGTMLESQLKYLKSLIKDENKINLQHVLDNIHRSSEIKTWELADAVCERNPIEALQVLQLTKARYLYTAVDKIAETLELLLAIKCMVNRGESASVASEFSMHPFRAKKFISYQKNYSEAELIAGLRLMLNCQRSILAGSDPKSVLDLALCQICTGQLKGYLSIA